MNIFLQIFLLGIAIIVSGYLFFHSAGILLSPGTQQNANNSVCFGSNCFSVDLAKTAAEREKGLMYVKEMPANKGMLFIFDNVDIYPFWMKNTLIALDMLWIDSNYKVVFIGQNIQPCRSFICPVTNPNVPAKYVLEINGNSAKNLGIKVGDTAVLNIQ